jgi:tRNA(fMet)-specific endonuclease VapC
MLDTNSCIFAINGNPHVQNRFVHEFATEITISAIVESELWFGVKNSSSPEKNAHILRTFLTTVTTLPFGTEAAVEYGSIRTMLKRSGTPIGGLDALIAAHAKSAGLICVTNNVREFKRVDGLLIEDWSTA